MENFEVGGLQLRQLRNVSMNMLKVCKRYEGDEDRICGGHEGTSLFKQC